MIQIILSKDLLLLKYNLKHIEEWCIANRLNLNYTKTLQVVFNALNKQISNPEHFKLKLGNQELETKFCTGQKTNLYLKEPTTVEGKGHC